MRNWFRCTGVYSNMHRVTLFLVCASTVLAQRFPQQALEQQNPLDAAIQAAWQARGEGRFEDTAALRDRARAMLTLAPVDSPRFAEWVMQVAQIYQNGNRNAQQRAILQEALTRTLPLGESHPSRIAILNALGESWRQDGNLMKAVGYLEQAAAQAGSQPAMRGGIDVSRLSVVRFGGGAVFVGGADAYMQLASLYRQLGRPDAVAAIAEKIRALSSTDESALARFYDQHGQPGEAAAIYKKTAEQATDSLAQANAWQSLADSYGRQERFADAATAMQKAIAVAQSLYSSGGPPQWMRESLGRYLRDAGQLDQADQVYRQILQERRGSPQESQVLEGFAMYLAETKRGAQAESLLKDYLESGANLDPQQRSNALYNLSTVARAMGDHKRAEEYQRAGQALQPPPLPPPPVPGKTRVAEDLESARKALNEGRLDAAYAFALHAVDMAAHAPDGEQAQYLVREIANSLAEKKEAAKADRLFQSFLALARSWSAENTRPLIEATQNYARFLMNQPDRIGEVPDAIEQYRNVLVEANGPESGSLTEPLRLKIEFARSHQQWEQAGAAARELLEWQESLSGNTSEPYLGDLQNVACIYEAAGDTSRALPLLRRVITIADLLATPNNDGRPSQTRMDAAFALARLGQFDDAETLGEEAVAMQRTMRTPRPPLAQQLEMIRRMKQAAAAARANRVDR